MGGEGESQEDGKGKLRRDQGQGEWKDKARERAGQGTARYGFEEGKCMSWERRTNIIREGKTEEM